MRGANCASSTATAPNDSQKPACNGASGSHVSTIAPTSTNIRGSDTRRPSGRTNSTSIVATHARSTATPQPARHAYSVTSTPPTHTPHHVMPPRASSVGLSRAIARPSATPNVATIVRCRPGDHHQVNRSGGAEQRPVGVVHQAAVAGQQREVDSCVCKRSAAYRSRSASLSRSQFQPDGVARRFAVSHRSAAVDPAARLHAS